MDELPQIETVEVSKREAVRLLASTIQGLRAKGYRMEKIAELVSARGVTISATTLKSYFHRVKASGKVAGRTSRRRDVAAGEQAGKDLNNVTMTSSPSPPRATIGALKADTNKLAPPNARVAPPITPSIAPTNHANDEAGTAEIKSEKQASNNLGDSGGTVPSLPHATKGSTAVGTKKEASAAASMQEVMPPAAKAIAPRHRTNDEAGTREPTPTGSPGDESGPGEATAATLPNDEPIGRRGALPSTNPTTAVATSMKRPVDAARATFNPREDSDDI